MARRALGISLASFPGASTALAELAAATGLVRPAVLQHADPAGVATRFLAELVAAQPSPGLVIFAGWSPAYDPLLRVATRRGLRVAVYWTSTAGQMEIGRELDRFTHMLEEPRIHHRWFASRELAEGFGPSVGGCAALPIVMSADGRRRGATRTAGRRRDDPVEIGCFCSPLEYHRKNVLTALLAVARIGREARLHVNGLTEHPFYEGVMSRLGLRVVDHGWMERAEYQDTIRTLDLGLQVSFAESFNYVTADHLVAGVPIVVSPMVPAVTGLPGPIARPFIARDPDSPRSIARTIASLLARPARTRSAVAAARRQLLAENRLRIAGARRLLERTLQEGSR